MILVRLINDHVLIIAELCKINVSWKVSCGPSRAQCGNNWSNASSADEMPDML